MKIQEKTIHETNEHIITSTLNITTKKEDHNIQIPKDILETLKKDRNIKTSTLQSYKHAIKNYEKYHQTTIQELLKEALTEEYQQTPMKNRKIKQRLLHYRTHLLQGNSNTTKTYFTRIKTIYTHFDITLPKLQQAQYHHEYNIGYTDLPTHQDIYTVLQNVNTGLQAIILFMTSTGTAKAETLSLTVQDFIDATREYHNNKGDIQEILLTLKKKRKIIPSYYIERKKTNKWYYTYSTPQATMKLIEYLQTRKNITPQSKLFPYTDSQLLNEFQKINDSILGAGFKGKYRFFRTHALRKWHASNIGLSSDYVDMLQGRTRNTIHETYIKTNPIELRNIYEKVMHNITIETEDKKEEESHNETFNIVINVFVNGNEYNIQ